MMRWIKRIAVTLIVLGLIGVAVVWYLGRSGQTTVVYRTATVKRDNLVVTIGATGTVEPEEVVDIGAQVAGTIESFGRDTKGQMIDYGSVVDNGTVLAVIDDSLYASDVATSQAQLAQARAGLVQAKANLGQMQAKLDQAQADWDRAQKIGPSEALAQTTYDGYKYGYEVAKANVAVGDAAIVQAQAAIDQAEAQFKRAQRNLGYCTIVSPVKGVIIDRRVNIGQTVVSSLSAPSLFLLAKDLTRMQVWVSVNEADVGNIHPGQTVTFMVDAFPGRVFRGAVGKVRLNATMVQNVVTYTVEVITDNSDGTLLPYLTANAQFEVSRHADVLQVPNAALRWIPPANQIVPDARAAASGGKTRSKGSKGASSGGGSGTEPGQEASKKGVLWVPEGSYARPINVIVGMTDGTMTEVQGKGVEEGLEVITGQEQADTGPASAANPFVPQFRGPSKSSSGK